MTTMVESCSATRPSRSHAHLPPYALGGGLGSVARFWLSETIAPGSTARFPWGTLAVNLTGCFAIGLLAVYTGAGSRPFNTSEARFFLLTGICGGYTTFSAFTLQTLALLRAVTQPEPPSTSSVRSRLPARTWLGFLLGSSLTTAR